MDVIPHGWEVRHFGRDEQGYSVLIGPLLARQEEDRCAYGLVIEPKHLNVHGVVHGGLIASLTDHGLGMIVWESVGREPCVTVELNLKYISAGQLGDLLTVRGEVIRATRSLVFVRGLITAGDRTVAMADGVWKRVGNARR